MRVNRGFTQFPNRASSCPEGEAKLSGYEHDCSCAKAWQRKPKPQVSSNFFAGKLPTRAHSQENDGANELDHLKIFA